MTPEGATTAEAPHEAVVSRPAPQATSTHAVLALCCSALGGLPGVGPTATSAARPDLRHFNVTGAVVGALVGIALVGLADALHRRAFRRADDAGFAWRDAWGRRRAVPWSDVVEARHVVQGRDACSFFTEVVLRGGRRVRLNDAWDGAEALLRRLLRGASRGVYRSAAAEDGQRVLFAYGSDDTRSEWRTLPLRAGILAALAVVPFTSPLGAVLHRLRDAPGPAGMVAVAGVAAVVGLIRRHLRAREGWRDEALAVDAEGIDVRGGAAPRFIPWRDVCALVVDGASVRLDTRAGPLAVLPGLDGAAHFLHLALREAPPEVAARHRREAFARQRLEPTERPDGTRRHHAKTRWHRGACSLLAAPLVVLALCAGALLAVQGSLAEWSLVALVCGPILLAVPASYAAWMARFHVTVGAAGCVWQGLLRRRAFRWDEVVAARLLAYGPAGLTLRFRDDTTLSCDPRHVADGDLLVDAVRRHAAHAVRAAS